MSHRNCPVHLAILAILSLGAASSFAAAPTISAFAPASGTLNATVTITGTNFVAPVTVSFDGVASPSVTIVSSTSVNATVPLTASTGVITLAASGGSANSASAFTVNPGVAVSPAVGPPTSSVRIYYSGFSAFEPVDLYFDTGDVALSSASSGGAGNCLVTIPASERPGVHWATAVGRRSVDSAQTTLTVQSNWPQYGFALNHKANNHYENVLSSATVGSLEEAWQTPAIVSSGPDAAPAVVNGIVYAGFTDGTIRAFNETTGAQEWSTPAGGSNVEYMVHSSPVVANGIVYAGGYDGNNYLFALDAVTGAMKPGCATGGSVVSSPTVVNGIVYFGTDNGSVQGVNATTGAVIWSIIAGNSASSSPLVANGVLYVGSLKDYVLAFNAATGSQIWSYKTGNRIVASPVLAGGLIYIGSEDGYMYALHAMDGSLVWTYNAGDAIESSAAASGGAVFFADSKGYVYSLSSSGSLLWSTDPLGLGEAALSDVSVANGVVYVAADNYTFALDQNTGALLTTLPVGSQAVGPIVINGAVFTGDLNDGILTRYTPNGLQSNYVAPRPEPMQLRPHRLR